MKTYDLIFSNDWKFRIVRHLLFWAAFYVYQVVRMSFLFSPNQLWNSVILILISSLVLGLFYNMVITYSVAYYLVPKFFDKKKYAQFAMGILVLLVIVFCYHILFSSIIKPFPNAVGTTKQHPYIFLRANIIRILGNPPLICALFLSLKTVKTWHLKQMENETLTREKANAELQLLKAQIHPHYLFTLTKSPLAAELVQKLSDMLNYMITDCDQILVPLEKEIQLLKDYIGLEKVRYGDRLDIQMLVNRDCKNCMIAPLLMIPFVENCFKHGASMMRGKQWMHLIININENNLDFNLSNSKPSKASATKHGIGLLNVHKRLELLYPGKHQLDIKSTENTFSVELKIELQTQSATTIEKKLINISKPIVFKPIIHY